MRVWFFFTAAIIATIGAFGGGCTSPPADKPAEPQPAMRALGQSVETSAPSSDEPSADSIGPEIRRLLNTDPSSTAGIIVEVDGDKVTLRGYAPTMAASWRAEGMAHSVKGVKTVENQITVKPAATAQ
jgi:osmotically-inducible protein OsmY